MDFIIKIEEFEGPMELLLELIRNREMNLYDLKISQITEDYLMSLEAMKEKDIDVTSDFMEMASMLLQIKSRMLIPKETEKEDPREELVQQILDYKEYKQAVDKMRELKEIEHKFFKSEKTIKIKKKRKGTIHDIIKSYQNILKNKLIKNKNQRFDDLTAELTKFKYTIEDRMTYIKECLGNDQIHVTSFFEQMNDKEEMVTTFGALLELVKSQYIAIELQGDDIYLKRREKNDSIN